MSKVGPLSEENRRELGLDRHCGFCSERIPSGGASMEGWTQFTMPWGWVVWVCPKCTRKLRRAEELWESSPDGPTG